MTYAQQFERRGDGLLVRAPAKLNLSLLIAGKRPDGFHELETVMAKVAWYDEILIERGLTSGIELACTGPHWAPEGPENLVYRAAEAAFAAANEAHDVRLTLTKNVPAGSGLGGASSDAAATLLGLNTYFQMGLSDSELARKAAELGSDVAFFLNGPLAFCTGRGEKIRKLTGDFKFKALLILPNINVPTAKIYMNYTHDNEVYRQLSDQANDYIAKNRIDLLTQMCANMLEAGCYGLFEELEELRDVIQTMGIEPLCLSGSGSTLFCILDYAHLRNLDNLRSKIASETGCQSIVVENNTW